MGRSSLTNRPARGSFAWRLLRVGDSRRSVASTPRLRASRSTTSIPRRIDTPLQRADVGTINFSAIGQFFLRQAAGVSQPPQIDCQVRRVFPYATGRALE